MRQPYENYLKCLIATGTADTAQLQLLARSAGFPEPATAYLTELRDSIHATRPTPFVLRSAAGRSYLRGIKVLSLATEDANAVAARNILSNMRLRAVLESLLVSGMDIDDVQKAVNRILRTEVPIPVLRLYRHYFCNYSRMTPADCNAFFEGYRLAFGSRLRMFYNKGPEFALWKLGDRSIPVNIDHVVDNILSESSHRFMELSSQPNCRDVALAAKMWTEQALKAAEFKKATGALVKDAEEALVKVALRLGRREISSVDELNEKGE